MHDQSGEMVYVTSNDVRVYVQLLPIENVSFFFLQSRRSINLRWIIQERFIPLYVSSLYNYHGNKRNFFHDSAV